MTTFGETVYAPQSVEHWNYFDHLLSEVKYWGLWSDGDIRYKPETKEWIFSRHANQVIAADATDVASLKTSPLVKNGIITDPTQYKQLFKAAFLDYVRMFMPGTTMQILNSVIPGAVPAAFDP